MGDNETKIILFLLGAIQSCFLAWLTYANNHQNKQLGVVREQLNGNADRARGDAIAAGEVAAAAAFERGHAAGQGEAARAAGCLFSRRPEPGPGEGPES